MLRRKLKKSTGPTNGTVSEGGRGGEGLQPTLEFGSSFNPTPTRGADYAHPITACPSGIENYLHLCLLTSFAMWIPKLFPLKLDIIYPKVKKIGFFLENFSKIRFHELLL